MIIIWELSVRLLSNNSVKFELVIFRHGGLSCLKYDAGDSAVFVRLAIQSLYPGEFVVNSIFWTKKWVSLWGIVAHYIRATRNDRAVLNSVHGCTVYYIKRQVTTLQRNLNFGWWRQSLDQAFNAIKFMIWRSDFTQESVLHGTKIFVRYRLSDKIENSRNYKITIFRTDSNLIGKVYYQYNSTVRFTKGIKYIIPGIQSVRCLSGFFVFFIICTFMLQAACLSRVHLHAISRNVNIASRNDVVLR